MEGERRVEEDGGGGSLNVRRRARSSNLRELMRSAFLGAEERKGKGWKGVYGLMAWEKGGKIESGKRRAESSDVKSLGVGTSDFPTDLYIFSL